MKIFLRLLSLSIIFITVAPLAHAGLHGEVDGFFLSDSFTTSRSDSNSRTYYSLDLLANLDQKGRFYAGFHVHQFDSQDAQGTATVTLNSMDMGPFIKWVLDRRKVFSLSLAYNISAKGTYKSGSTSSTLDGTSIVGSIDIMPEVAENLFIGVKMNYYSISYATSVTGTANANVAYSRSFIFPSLSLSWRR